MSKKLFILLLVGLLAKPTYQSQLAFPKGVEDLVLLPSGGLQGRLDRERKAEALSVSTDLLDEMQLNAIRVAEEGQFNSIVQRLNETDITEELKQEAESLVRDSLLHDSQKTALNSFINHLEKKKAVVEEEFEVIPSAMDLENNREEIFSEMSRFGKSFPKAYVASLEQNQNKIERETRINIPLDKVYEYLNLPDAFATQLPHEVILEVIDAKVGQLKEVSMGEFSANMLGRQLKWIFKNKTAKENYDAFLSNNLESLIFEDEGKLTELHQSLEDVIEEKNKLAQQVKYSQEYLYGNISRDLINLIKSSSAIETLISRASIYFPNLWSDGNMARSILRGALATYALLNKGDEIFGQIFELLDLNNNRIDRVRDIMNYFFALAVNKNQWFEEGSFMVYHNGASNLLKLLFDAGGFKRLSSHFKSLKLNQFGLDVPDMPENKTHLLFAELATNALFIKPENYGVGLYSLPGHSWEYVVAQGRKLGVWGSDQEHGMRKERIPAKELSQYADLLGVLEVGAELQRDYILEAKTLGIRSIYNKLQQFEIEYPGFTEEIQTLKAQLEKDYDHLGQRFGQEVILGPDELNIFTPEFLHTVVTEFPGSVQVAE